MPIKRLFNPVDKDVNMENLIKKVDILDSQVKKLKTVDLHFKRILEMEKTLKLYELKEKDKQNQDWTAAKTGKSGKNTDHHSDKIQKDNQNKPVYRSVDGENRKISASSEWTRIEEMEQRIKRLEEAVVKQQDLQLVKHEVQNIERENIAKWFTQLIYQELEPYKQQLKIWNDKVSQLEMYFDELKKEFSMIKENHKTADENKNTESTFSKEPNPEKGPSSVIYQEIKIEKVYLDKYELNNNFAQLGIKELGGQLNIGATYGSGAIPEEVIEQGKEAKESMQEMKEEFEAERDLAKEDSNPKDDEL
ncbi:hypothetical protein [Cytobacillus oceanisediminis]|uniref:hypothetical protein n=1 Tax=Cytobacillus oceanisediminis TaxID=665099 RepID=UPI00119DF488|nr:hypothetical protein [Cytobacillus oceanisediminis]